MRSRIVGAAAALLICGCASSPPLRYYVLSEVSSAATTSSPSAGDGSAIQITRITLPRELDRSQLVQRIDANRLRIAEDDRWAAPLDDLIRRALAADLRARAGAGRTGELSVQIESFSADLACGVELRASWEWRTAGATAPVQRQRADIRTPSVTHVCPIADVPVRMSEALALLAEHMLGETDSTAQ